MPQAITEKNTLTMLLAEDDDGHAGLVIRNLRRIGLGYEILRFGNGTEILEYLLQHRSGTSRSGAPLVLILGLNMPGTDGFTVLENLKRHERTRIIPVFVLSTTHTQAEIERCNELGCNAFLCKSVDYTRFTEAIAKLAVFFSIIELPEY